MLGGEMNRVGFVLKVKADKIEEYKEHHKKVWPEMLEALRRTGWHNYSLFMRSDGTLFGYFETPTDLKTAVAAMSNEEVNARWQAMMAPYFESLDGSRPDEMMKELEEVFHLD
jgi:L-rhamnose mutarotase